MSDPKFQQALSKIPYGVSVVTVGLGGIENGLTVSWLTQVSFDPPMIAFSIDKGHYSSDLLNNTPHFVVNLLADGQARLATHFARQSMTGERKLDTVDFREADSGLAILNEALAYFDCEVQAVHPAGDHLLVIGLVKDAQVLNDAAPMTSLQGLRYRK